ncbi:hypothetical protein [Streptomyces sp. NPDC058398]|uniref:hypothetical protein n=1 Tax=Streptomyces sp. NPDC058398 TaxID=3346479 RepID=UPI00366133B2
MTAPSFERFLFLSVDLTAFEETDLLGTGMAHTYLAKVRAACGDEVVTTLLDAHRAARDDAAGDAGSHARSPLDRDLFDRALRHRIFGDERLGPVARNVIKLWYAGMWYALPADWTDRYGAQPAAETSTVTAAAYQEGLLWRAIGANPPGAKAPGYGSWAQPPRIADRYLKGATR